jgi:uncharacterized protein (UPF0335 family)
MRDVSNSEDILDSRDVIERIEELESERSDLESELEEAQEELDELNTDDDLAVYEAAQKRQLAAKEALDLFDQSEDAEELRILKALAEEGSSYASDWDHGATLIRESYFVDYTEELCKDIGDVPQDLPGYLAIDWEKTAENIKVDYTELDFDGVTYLVR